MTNFKNTKLAKLIAFTFCSAIIMNINARAQSIQDAIKFTENEQFETATKAFKSLLKGQPTNGEVYYYIGENYFKNEEKTNSKNSNNEIKNHFLSKDSSYF